MTIQTGDQMPSATFAFMGDDGPASTTTDEMTKDKTIVVFSLPGAFTGVCTTAHMPSFIKNADAIRAKGVDAIYCITANDVFVNDEWDKATGASDAGVQILSDATSDYTQATGLMFTAPPVGLINRPKRSAMIVKNGEIAVLNVEDSPGECTISAGETILEAL